MSSASSGLAATGVQSVQLIEQESGLTYPVRIVAEPSDSVSCRTPAGIQRARVGGSTQAESLARTVSTPAAAHASW
jgi:hypothetical protein